MLLYEIFIESAFIRIRLCYFHFPEKLRDSVHVVLYSIVVRMRRLLTSLCQGFVDQNFFHFLYPTACETSLLEQQIPTTPIMSPGHPGNPVPPDQRSGNVTKRCEAAWLAAAAFSSSGLHHVGQTPSQLNLDKHAAIRKFSRVQASARL